MLALTGLLLAGLATIGPGAQAEPDAPIKAAGRIEIPPELEVPPGNRLVGVFPATGVQVYQCAAAAWSFLEPAAELSTGSTPVAVHFRGPSWESVRDGSLVEARSIASVPVRGSIPQLLLEATRVRGRGLFGQVTYIQRLTTTGGAAPTGACVDGDTAGIPYTANYLFYVRGL